ncbi:hypothetical protein DPMN_143582 [Dreissena polymorpha]|uniref:Uncharacterized protein n=1 Tax=Dreissena polymorpha TaxID=45954 RepID=A0A9D4GDZ5_DREPO|nr:hypothetical protein DPMN_143582 [Dreissena polymorpha]
MAPVVVLAYRIHGDSGITSSSVWTSFIVLLLASEIVIRDSSLLSWLMMMSSICERLSEDSATGDNPSTSWLMMTLSICERLSEGSCIIITGHKLQDNVRIVTIKRKDLV